MWSRNAFPPQESWKRRESKITYGNDEGHTKELSSQSSFDFIQKIIKGCAQVPQDKSEFRQCAIKNIVVVLDHLIPMLLAVLTSGTGQEQMSQIRGWR